MLLFFTFFTITNFLRTNKPVCMYNFRTSVQQQKMLSSSSSHQQKKKVAVVTGANRGIGLQIVKDLCQQLEPATWDVLLTARNENSGEEQTQKISSAPVEPKFHSLDIENRASIDQLRKNLIEQYDGLDILVQNAGVYIKDTGDTFAVIAEQTLKANYWAVRDVCRIFLPIMRDNSSLVLVASRMGCIYFVKDAAMRKRLVDGDVKVEELDELMQSYVDGVQRRELSAADVEKEEKVWDERAFKSPYGPYSVSKLGVIALARALQLEIDAKRIKILVTSCSPGYVATGMTDFKGTRTVEEGADTPVYLALLSSHEDKKGDELSPLKGLFIHDRQVVDWANYKPDNWRGLV